MNIYVISLFLSSCDLNFKATSEETSSFTLPEGLKDCKIYGIQNGNSMSLSVVRCPNSTVSTTYKSGKTTVTTVVIDGKKYVSEEWF